MLAKKRRRLEIAFTDAEGVGWVVRAQWRRTAVLGLDGSCQSVAREMVLFFTSELGEMRRSRASVTEEWARMSEEELKAEWAHAYRIGRGPGMVAP